MGRWRPGGAVSSWHLQDVCVASGTLCASAALRLLCIATLSTRGQSHARQWCVRRSVWSAAGGICCPILTLCNSCGADRMASRQSLETRRQLFSSRPLVGAAGLRDPWSGLLDPVGAASSLESGASFSAHDPWSGLLGRACRGPAAGRFRGQEFHCRHRPLYKPRKTSPDAVRTDRRHPSP